MFTKYYLTIQILNKDLYKVKKTQATLTKQYPNSTSDSFIITNRASEAIDLTLRAITNKKNIYLKKSLLLNYFIILIPK